MTDEGLCTACSTTPCAEHAPRVRRPQVSETICEVCARGPAPERGGVAVYRQNAFGVPGIWRCAEHRTAPVDPEVQEIVDAIEEEVSK